MNAHLFRQRIKIADCPVFHSVKGEPVHMAVHVQEQFVGLLVLDVRHEHGGYAGFPVDIAAGIGNFRAGLALRADWVEECALVQELASLRPQKCVNAVEPLHGEYAATVLALDSCL